MRKLGDLLIAFQKKKSKKAQWFLHLNKTFIGFTTDLHTSDKSIVAIFQSRFCG